MKKNVFVFALLATLIFLSCQREWKPGMPLAKETVIIGVLHITDPFSESSGFSYAHQLGIEEMKRNLGLNDSQILNQIHVDDQDPMGAESAMRELITRGARIIIATAEGYGNSSVKLADEYPNIVFAQLYSDKYNSSNLTNYYGRVYQARYLSGVLVGLKTETNRIGYVAAWGNDNSQVTSGLNAFALGVEKVNPQARVYVRVTHSWFDPMGEANAARDLIALGCDVIAQHVDTAVPQLEAERAGVWGIGYNTDMSIDAPGTVLTSVIWYWGAYYTYLVQSVIDGSFTTAPWYGSLADGIIDLSPLNRIAQLEPEAIRIYEDERQRIESGVLNVFSGVMETNDGRFIGTEGVILSDTETQFGIDWYYWNIIEF